MMNLNNILLQNEECYTEKFCYTFDFLYFIEKNSAIHSILNWKSQ